MQQVGQEKANLAKTSNDYMARFKDTFNKTLSPKYGNSDARKPTISFSIGPRASLREGGGDCTEH